MTTRNAEDPIDILTTTIYKSTEFGDRMVGALDSDGVLTTPGDPKARGRVSSAGTVFRVTTYGEREIGTVSPTGTVHSHGLFEGGDLRAHDEALGLDHSPHGLVELGPDVVVLGGQIEEGYGH